MATLTYNKYDHTIEAIFYGLHNLNVPGSGGDTLKLALSNTAPTAATDEGLADISEISAGNGYTAGGEALVISSSAQTSGTMTIAISAAAVWTASGGSMAAFRYLALYNDTSTGDKLLGYWDRGSSLTLNDSDVYTADISGTIFTAS
jgi:hypothetical protein